MPTHLKSLISKGSTHKASKTFGKKPKNKIVRQICRIPPSVKIWIDFLFFVFCFSKGCWCFPCASFKNQDLKITSQPGSVSWWERMKDSAGEKTLSCPWGCEHRTILCCPSIGNLCWLPPSLVPVRGEHREGVCTAKEGVGCRSRWGPFGVSTARVWAPRPLTPKNLPTQVVLLHKTNANCFARCLLFFDGRLGLYQLTCRYLDENW